MKVHIVFQTFALLLIAPFVAPSVGLSQSSPGDDPQSDKSAWLQMGSPTIFVGTACQPPSYGLVQDAQVNGVMWATLVQTKNFLMNYPGSAALCITGGSERGHSETGLKSHANGFKVDLRIDNPSNTNDDPLSQFVFGATSDGGCRSSALATPPDGAPQRLTSNDMVWALEYPTVQPPGLCVPPNLGFAKSPHQHFDVLSSFDSLDAPQTLNVQIGQQQPINAIARDDEGNDIGLDSTMFQYDADSPEVATVNDSGLVAGIQEGTTSVYVSEGFLSLTMVDVTVQQPNPPDDGPICQGSDRSQWAGCWAWDSSSTSWIWYPSVSNPTPPGPNDPPPPGQCPGNSALAAPQTGCWVWDPTANNGAGAWIFTASPGGGSGTANWPVTPVTSYDPNEIIGPPGAGNSHFVGNIATPSTYLVQFENQVSATAPAQQVVVTDSLSSADFDLSTATLGPITFPGQIVTPPAVPLALGPFTTEVDLRPATNLIVNVTASLVSETGLLTWKLTSLDPTTLLPPTDPLAGFLPPGMDGAVSLIVTPISSLPTGTALSDQASVVFDTNAPISTAAWLNTIDSTSPTSSVTALPATEYTPSFAVSWQGTDIGSGIQDFTIYASDNGGAFVQWQTNVTGTGAIFAGQFGHTYSFYSIARDMVGNIEPTKTSSEATTQVLMTPIIPQVNFPAPAPIVYGTPLSGSQLNAAVASGISGIFTYTPPLGTVLPAGEQSLAVLFTPTDATYYASTSTNVQIAVNPAPLTVTANNASRLYGAPDPSFTGTVTGAVNGDALTETFSTAATTNSPVGPYSIVPGVTGMASANYMLTLQNGTLTVNPALLTATANSASRVYGTANPSFTGTVTGVVDGDTFTETFATNATASSPVGPYSIVPAVTGTGLPNYTLTTQNGILTVTQAGSSVQLSSSATGPVVDGSSVVLTANAVSATTGTPTGSATFLSGQTRLATVALSQGVAKLTTSTLPSGINSVTASYGGDTNFTASTSIAETVSVNAPDYSLSADTTTLSLAAGQSGTATITVTPLGYSGPVNFSLGALPSYVTCIFSPSNLINLSGTATAQVQVNVQVAATVSMLNGNRFVVFAMLLVPLGLPGLMPVFGGNRKLRLCYLAVLVLACAVAGVMVGCSSGSGGSSSSSTAAQPTQLPPAGTQTIMLITSGSGGISHQLPLQIRITN